MNELRRMVLKGTGAAATLAAALAAGLAAPARAFAAAWNQAAFGAKSAKDALANLGASNAVPSKDISIEAPEIAENGAVGWDPARPCSRRRRRCRCRCRRPRSAPSPAHGRPGET